MADSKNQVQQIPSNKKEGACFHPLLLSSASSSCKRPEFFYKIVLIGDSEVGKTSLINRFAKHEFDTSYIPTIGIDFMTRDVEIGDRRVRLQIWDTAGQERFHSIGTHFYRGAAAIMFVFDVSVPRSLQNVSSWFRSVSQHVDLTKTELLLVGNKTDLYDRRIINPWRGEREAVELGMRYAETSSKLDSNVDSAFYDLACAVHSRRMNDGDNCPNCGIKLPIHKRLTFPKRNRQKCCRR